VSSAAKGNRRYHPDVSVTVNHRDTDTEHSVSVSWDKPYKTGAANLQDRPDKRQFNVVLLWHIVVK